MHSRIFGIVEKNFYDENIDNYNWNLDIFEEETPSFADYCSMVGVLVMTVMEIQILIKILFGL